MATPTPPLTMLVWCLTQHTVGEGRKDLALARYKPIEQGMLQELGIPPVWSLSFSLHPGKQSPAVLGNLAPCHWLPSGVATGQRRGYSSRRWEQRERPEYFFPHSLLPHCPWAPPTPCHILALMRLGNNAIPSRGTTNPPTHHPRVSGITAGSTPWGLSILPIPLQGDLLCYVPIKPLG